MFTFLSSRHAFAGWVGIISTALFGVVFLSLFLSTGSIAFGGILIFLFTVALALVIATWEDCDEKEIAFGGIMVAMAIAMIFGANDLHSLMTGEWRFFDEMPVLIMLTMGAFLLFLTVFFWLGCREETVRTVFALAPITGPVIMFCLNLYEQRHLVERLRKNPDAD